MNVSDLVAHYPCLYHMAEDGSWPSIREHGLLSTTYLLDLFGYSGSERTQYEAQRRAETVEISHQTYGCASLRDQKPMTDSALRRCLHGITPTEWYRLLNGRVFFWLTEERLVTLLQGRA